MSVCPGLISDAAILTKSNLGEERNYVTYTSWSQSLLKRIQGKEIKAGTWSRNQEWIQFSHLLFVLLTGFC